MQVLIDKVKEIVKEAEEKAPYLISKNGKKFAILGESDGDAMLFNGLLSTVIHSYDNWALDAVLDSQGENGMFYRSPHRKETNNEGHEAFFSRDMSHGVLCAMTNVLFPESAAISWLNYIDNLKEWHWLLYKFAPDSRSAITPANWALMGRVWGYRLWKKHDQMKKFNGFDGDFSVIEAKTTDLGYQLHLKVVAAYIKFLINQSREYSQKIAEIAHQRLPDNIFYEFVAKRCFTLDMIERFIEISNRVDFNNFGHSWIWEKSSIESHLESCCGWDLFFMGKLILANQIESYS
jgi:hypothetical protein